MAGKLAALGFADAATAGRLLAEDLRLDVLGADAEIVAALAATADPDQALTGLVRLAESQPAQTQPPGPELLGALPGDPGLRARLLSVLGVSTALADHLARHPADRAVLRGPDADTRPAPAAIRAELLASVGAGPDDPQPRAVVAAERPGAREADPAALLAAAYRRRVLHLAARDLTGVATVDEVGEELADIAAAVLEAALAVARAEIPRDSVPCRLAIVAMGKCGGRELNYASDVDVIFVAEPVTENTEEAAMKTATRLASGVIRVCERSTPEGSIFPVDPNLRPEGRHGPLVRTLASHLAYYDRWAKTWEFQALLKARPVAGDRDLGDQYMKAVTPLVGQASQRENFVEDVQAMRRRVEATLPRNLAGRELKLGPGGLRDIEFAVQLLQLVHGRTDERVRAPATLPALKALAEGGYVTETQLRQDIERLENFYRDKGFFEAKVTGQGGPGRLHLLLLRLYVRRGAGLGRNRRDRGVVLQPANVVHHLGSRGERGRGHGGFAGIDRDRDPSPRAQRLDQRDDPVHLLLGRHFARAGAGGFSAHVDDVGAAAMHLERVLERATAVEVAAAVGKRIGCEVEHAHHGRKADHLAAFQPER